jgi:hypothetical protein
MESGSRIVTVVPAGAIYFLEFFGWEIIIARLASFFACHGWTKPATFAKLGWVEERNRTRATQPKPGLSVSDTADDLNQTNNSPESDYEN